jgi:hypothetical protein
MKNSPSSRPRLHCRLVRLWCPDTGPRPRHAESCADCREYFRASDALESALRRDAIRHAPEIPAGLEHGIMRAIRASAPAPAPSRPRLAFFAAGAVAIAAVAVVAVALWRPASHVAGPVALAANPTAAAPVVAVAGPSISVRLWNAIVPRAETLAGENPLQTELTSVYSDARSALDFLALNFLPEAQVAAVSNAGRARGEG